MFAFHAFWVGTPFTTQWTPFEKHQCPHSWAIIHIIFLHIEDQCFSFNDPCIFIAHTVQSPICNRLPFSLAALLEMCQHCSADNFILYVFAQFNEECTVSRYTNDQITILFWMLLGFDQCIVIQIVELHLAIAE